MCGGEKTVHNYSLYALMKHLFKKQKTPGTRTAFGAYFGAFFMKIG